MNEERERTQVVVIGLDGATFKVLWPLIEVGLLPVLEGLVARSAAATLLSTVPPVTALAWPSFMTGKNPGKHGTLGWQERLNEHFQRPHISGQGVQGSKLWDIAGEAGLRSCVVNVPVTYPPRPLQGTMISGMLTPGLETNFTFPQSLKAELLSAVPDYRLDVDVQHTERSLSTTDAIHSFLEEVRSTTRSRERAIHWLWDREPWDLAVSVFELPDRLQHLLWGHIARLVSDPTQAAYEPLLADLLDTYQLLDTTLGCLLSRVSDDAYVLLLSDHGFGPLETLVHLGDWLAARGWLAYNRARLGVRQGLRRVGRRVKQFIPAGITRRARGSFTMLQTLDWTRTQAYPGLPSENGIFINMQDREPAGIVSQVDYELLRSAIITALQAWRDPRDSQPVMNRVHRREEVYSGPCVDRAPDIVFELTPGYKLTHLPGEGDWLSDISGEMQGFHEREGVLVALGPGIRTGMVPETPAIEDVAPTVLYVLGLPVPEDMDGRVLTELFQPEMLVEHPVQRQTGDTTRLEALPCSPYSEEEAQKIEHLLRNLGYLE